MIFSSYETNIVVVLVIMIVNTSLENAIQETYQNTGLPVLFNKDDFILEEVRVETELECGFRCLQNLCTGFLFKTQDQLDDIQCYSSSSHLDYTGTYNKTVTGRTCQRWDSQSPHIPTINTAVYFPESTLTEAENYCRDGDNSGFFWCYTTDPLKRWDSCDVMKCMSPDNNCRLYNDGSMVPDSPREGYKYYTISG